MRISPKQIEPNAAGRARNSGKWRIVALGVCALLTGAVLLLRNPAEPHYQGRTLSQWLATSFDFQDGRWVLGSAPGFQAAMEAMGTNATPHLIRMLKKNDPPLSQFLLQNVFKDITHPVWHRLGMNHALLLRRRAANGFRALGARATNAIPELLKGRPTGELVEALDGIGSSGLPVVLECLRHGDEQTRFTALFALQAGAYDQKTAVEQWIQHTTNASPKLRWAATTLLWKTPRELQQPVFAALQRAAADPDPRVALMAGMTSNRLVSMPNLEGTLIPP